MDDLQTHDPDLYRVARKGRFGVNGTLVFPQFVVEPANQVEKEIKAIRTPLEKNGMDFGFVTSYKAYSNDPGIDYNKMEKCMKSAVRELTLSVGSRELGRIIDEHLRERGIL